MQIVALYSFNGGQEVMEKQHPVELMEIRHIIESIDAEQLINKQSKESRRNYEMLYAPREMNDGFKAGFKRHGWSPVRVKCDYPTEFYIGGYKPKSNTKGSFREMDFVKNRIGIEVQFGKYSFMVYNVAAKMTIFNNLGYINVGVEIVPVKELAIRMSSGVSYFEQFVWDLEQRGTADIDIPVLIMGIASFTGATARQMQLTTQADDEQEELDFDFDV